MALAERSTANAVSLLPRYILAPARAVIRTGLTGILFTILTVTIVATALYYFRAFTHEQIDLFYVEGHCGHTTHRFIGNALNIAVWLPLIPATLIGVLLPLRLQWIHGKVTPAHMSRDWNWVVRAGMVAINLSARQLIIGLLPAAALAFVYHQLLQRGKDTTGLILIGALTVVLLLLGPWRSVAALCIAPICILSGCAPIAAARESSAVVRRYAPILLVVIVATLALIVFLAVMPFSDSLNALTATACGVIASFAIWYLLAAQAELCLAATAAYLRQAPQGFAQYGLPPTAPVAPIEPTPQPPQQPVTIHIENFWLDPAQRRQGRINRARA